MDTKQIKKDTIERAFAVCKRYSKLAERIDYNYCDEKNRKKYYAMRDKLHDATHRAIMKDNDLYAPTSLMYLMIVKAVDNGKGKDAVFNALELLGFQII